MKKVLAMVMAGGKGERLFPLTKDRAKPAVPFGGVYRIIDFTLSNCINSGLKQICVLTQYKSQSLNRHLKIGWNFLPYMLGEYIDTIPPQQRTGEGWYLGTADAIRQNIYTIKQDIFDVVLILAGDHIYKMNYQKMLKFHNTTNAHMTVAAIEMDINSASQFGVIEVDRRNRVIGFEEKPLKPKCVPGNPEKALVSMGIYAFQTKRLIELLTENKGYDFGKDIIPHMVDKSNDRVYAYLFEDENQEQGKEKYWKDVGTIDSYYEANMDLVQVNPTFNLYDNKWPIRTYQTQSPPVKTVFSDWQGGRVGMAQDSLVSSGCIISGSKVYRSVISPGVRINSYAEVSHSVISNGVNIGRHCQIHKAIIDKYSQIPDGMTIGLNPEQDRKLFTISKNGVVVAPKGFKL